MELGFDLDDDVVDRLAAARPLLARLEDRPAELLPIERLAPTVALDHVRQHVLDVLVGRVPPVALEAFAPAPDELAVSPHARIDDPIFRVAAERTLHRPPPCLYPPLARRDPTPATPTPPHPPPPPSLPLGPPATGPPPPPPPRAR